MTSPLKLFVIGLVAALVCFGTCRLMVMRMNWRLESLVSACHAANKREQAKGGIYYLNLCDPKVIAADYDDTDTKPVGMQAEIALAYNTLVRYRRWTWRIPAFIVALSIVPSLWYFFRELSRASIGRG